MNDGLGPSREAGKVEEDKDYEAEPLPDQLRQELDDASDDADADDDDAPAPPLRRAKGRAGPALPSPWTIRGQYTFVRDPYPPKSLLERTTASARPTVQTGSVVDIFSLFITDAALDEIVARTNRNVQETCAAPARPPWVAEHCDWPPKLTSDWTDLSRAS
jgi:hypothetical protein